MESKGDGTRGCKCTLVYVFKEITAEMEQHKREWKRNVFVYVMYTEQTKRQLEVDICWVWIIVRMCFVKKKRKKDKEKKNEFNFVNDKGQNI